ncbi:MAG TPA: HTTM domain-containing protein [Kofleriaceae bacterium]|jgi:hypothetical protein
MAKPTAPAFWFDFTVPWLKLATTRVVLFGLLALDAFLQIRHAPRYGAGGFNVAQLSFLDRLGPTRVSYELCQLAVGYLCVFVVCNVGTRVLVPIVAALYAWLYFGSQLDSYQHHYLMCVLLFIACFVPWDAPRGEPVRSWAVRLILFQLAILYLWAAISKLSPAWLDGRTLGGQLSGSLRSLIDSTVGISLASKLVVLTELGLAATIWSKRTAAIAAPIGLLFHLGIVASGLEIGLFAWLMIAIYALVIPDRLWELVPVPPLRTIIPRRGTIIPLVVGGALVAAGVGLAGLVRVPYALATAAVLAVVPVALALRDRPGALAIGVASLAAVALWFVADRATTVAPDYYRFWGGSARRLGDLPTSEAAYRALLAIAPDDAAAHVSLGRTLLAEGRAADGLAELHEAQHQDAAHARAWIEEARWLAQQGRMPEALAAAKEGTYAEPTNRDARALVDQLSQKKPAALKPATDDDTE